MIRLQNSHKWIGGAFCAMLITTAVSTASAQTVKTVERREVKRELRDAKPRTVPDGWMTAQLLGVSLVTLEVVRRKLKAR